MNDKAMKYDWRDDWFCLPEPGTELAEVDWEDPLGTLHLIAGAIHDADGGVPRERVITRAEYEARRFPVDIAKYFGASDFKLSDWDGLVAYLVACHGKLRATIQRAYEDPVRLVIGLEGQAAVRFSFFRIEEKPDTPLRRTLAWIAGVLGLGRPGLPRFAAVGLKCDDSLAQSLPSSLASGNLSVHEVESDCPHERRELRRDTQSVDVQWMNHPEPRRGGWLVLLTAWNLRRDLPLLSDLYDRLVTLGAQADDNEMDRLREAAAGRKPPRRERRY